MAEIALGILISAAVTTASTLITAALAPPNEATRLSDINPLRASYGDNIPLIFGQVRVPGTIFWSPALHEYEEDDTYKYKGTCAVAFCRTWDNFAIYQVIFGNKRIIWEASNPSVNKYGIYHQNGPNVYDTVIQQYEGTNIPRFEGIAYIRFTKGKLQKFGNALPNFEAIVNETATPTLKTVLERVCLKAGLASGEFGFIQESFFTGIYVHSAKLINDGSTYRQFIEDLQVVFNFSMRDVGGRIEFLPTLQLDGDVVISGTQLGCQPETQGVETGKPGDETFSLYSQQDESDLDLPTRIEIEYFNRANQYRKSSAAYNQPQFLGDNTKQISIKNIAVDSQEASNLAQLSYKYARNSARKYQSISMGFVYASEYTGGWINPQAEGLIKPGVRYDIPLKQGIPDQVVEKAELSTTYISSISTIDYYGGASESPALADVVNNPIQPLPAEDIPMSVIETSPLTTITADNESSIFYHAKINNITNPPDSMKNYYEYSNVIVPVSNSSKVSVTGKVITNPIPHTSHLFYDETTTVILEVDESFMTLEILSTNSWLIAQQVLYFSTGELMLVREATLVAPKTYSCKGLIRGWQGTEVFIGKPTPLNTKFTLVEFKSNQAGYVFRDEAATLSRIADNSVLNQSVDFFTMDVDSDEETHDPAFVTDEIVSGRSLETFPPAVYDYNVVLFKITIARRSRGFFSNNFNPPYNGSLDSYRFDLVGTSHFIATADLFAVFTQSQVNDAVAASTIPDVFEVKVRQEASLVSFSEPAFYKINRVTGAVTYSY